MEALRGGRCVLFGRDSWHEGENLWLSLSLEWSAGWPNDCNSWGNTAQEPPKNGNQVSGPSADWLESNDVVAVDWTNMKVYVEFSPSLQYYNQYGWQPAKNAYSYTAFGPPNSIG